jgi:hypothetical protein
VSGEVWAVLPEKSSPGVWLEVADPDGWYEAVVKWDGCIHFHHAGNVPFRDDFGHSTTARDKHACDDYIHLCDLDDMIARLQALREVAVGYFGETWPR